MMAALAVATASWSYVLTAVGAIVLLVILLGAYVGTWRWKS